MAGGLKFGLIIAVGAFSLGCEGVIGSSNGGDPDANVAPAIDAAPPTSGVAPDDIRPEAPPLDEGDTPIDVADGTEATYRIETVPGEHVGFDLRFPQGTDGVLLTVDRWDGEAVVELQVTDGGIGIRTLAVLDQDGPRTFWVRISADEPIVGATLTVTRTPFSDGSTCAADCALLLQLPVPNDSAIDGYSIQGSTFRYQFGRRDMVMFVRHAGMKVVGEGMKPFIVGDLSQWNGEIPGTDRSAPRHASHDRGKDVDITLYGADGDNFWRSYCTTTNNGSGRECNPGSLMNYDGYANALMFSAFYESGRVTRAFLDDELQPATISGADSASADGKIDSALLPLYADGVHLQHWPNHDNHIHVRVSEAKPGAFTIVDDSPP